MPFDVVPPSLSESDSFAPCESVKPISTPPIDLAAASDLDLMALIGVGDRAAFSTFCRRHAERCFAVAQHLLRNSADAEEVVQDAFLRVWQSAHRWRSTEARVTTWLFRVVVNLSLDQMRRASRWTLSIEHAAETIASDPNPEVLTEQREMALVISRAVAVLPPRQRAALSLVVTEGLDCAEAAKTMQVSVGTMESLLVRARRRLRQALVEAAKERTGARESTNEGARAKVLSSPAPRTALVLLPRLGT